MTGEHILIVRPGALGDTILSAPLVHSIRNRRHGARITFLGNQLYRDLLPSDVEFARFDSTEWLWLMGNSTAELPPGLPIFDRAYVVLKNPGHVLPNLRRAGVGRVVHASPDPTPGRHMVAMLHESLGFPVPIPKPSLGHLRAAETQDGENAAIADAPEAAPQDILWVHPGSGGPSKCLPLTLMRELVDELRRATGYKVAVTVGEEDAFLKEHPEWGNLVGSPGTMILERRPLLDLCRMLGAARLFVGNDSGMSHLAAGLGVPAAVFFVATDPDVWAPWTMADRLQVMDLRGLNPERIDLQRYVSNILRLLTRE